MLQTVVFTRFFDTLTDIVGRLRTRAAGLRVGTYAGGAGSTPTWRRANSGRPRAATR